MLQCDEGYTVTDEENEFIDSKPIDWAMVNRLWRGRIPAWIRDRAERQSLTPERRNKERRENA